MGHKFTARTGAREHIKAWGSFRRHGRRYDVELLDLSERGCRLFDRHSNLGIGEEIRLTIEMIGPFTAHVRWRKDDYAGLEFESAIYAPTFDHIIANKAERRG